MRRSVVAFLMLLAALLAPGGTSWALSGDEWLKASEEVRKYYVIGVIDTWMGLYVSWESEKERLNDAPLNETDKEYHEIAACVLDRKMGYPDVLGVVDMHVRMSIDKRDASMSYLAFEALRHSCNRSPLF